MMPTRFRTIICMIRNYYMVTKYEFRVYHTHSSRAERLYTRIFVSILILYHLYHAFINIPWANMYQFPSYFKALAYLVGLDFMGSEYSYFFAEGEFRLLPLTVFYYNIPKLLKTKRENFPWKWSIGIQTYLTLINVGNFINSFRVIVYICSEYYDSYDVLPFLLGTDKMFSVLLFITLLLHLFYYYKSIIPEISFQPDTHVRSYAVVRSKTGERESLVMVENELERNIISRRNRLRTLSNNTTANVLADLSPADKVEAEDRLIAEATQLSEQNT